jgi:hypothetical protein
MAAPLNSILEVGIRGRANSQVLLTILHYRVSVVAGTSDTIQEQVNFLNAINATGANSLVNPYLAAVSNQYTMDEITAQFVAATRLRRSTQVVGTAGSLAGNVNAQNVAAVITKRTAFGGRKQLGSVHLGGLPDSSFVLGMVSAAQLALMTTLATALNQTVTPVVGAGSYVPVLWHRNDAVQPSSDRVTDHTPQTTLRVMRRRTVGLGI